MSGFTDHGEGALWNTYRKPFGIRPRVAYPGKIKPPAEGSGQEPRNDPRGRGTLAFDPRGQVTRNAD